MYTIQVDSLELNIGNTEVVGAAALAKFRLTVKIANMIYRANQSIVTQCSDLY
jgi:hypothetical protein